MSCQPASALQSLDVATLLCLCILKGLFKKQFLGVTLKEVMSPLTSQLLIYGNQHLGLCGTEEQERGLLRHRVGFPFVLCRMEGLVMERTPPADLCPECRVEGKVKHRQDVKEALSWV